MTAPDDIVDCPACEDFGSYCQVCKETGKTTRKQAESYVYIMTGFTDHVRRYGLSGSPNDRPRIVATRAEEV